MAESKQYRLPNTEGTYITVPVTNTSGEVYRIDGTKTIYGDYFVENGNTVLEASAFSSEEFQRNLRQNSQAYRRTIGDSILDATGQTNSQPDPNESEVLSGSTLSNVNQEVEQEPSLQNLQYPVDMVSDQDAITFTAVEYIAPGLEASGSKRNLRENPERSIIGSATLPIQAQIVDANKVKWSDGELNEIFRSALNIAQELVIGGNKEQQEKSINDAITKVAGQLEGNKDQVLALIAEGIFNQPIISRTGGILNPNLELLFNGPTLRDFNFNIRMTPRSSEESKQVKAIIKFFKKNMASKSEGGLFLKAPNTFLIKYRNKSNRGEEGLNKIKECALLGCSVNYTPQGSYMTYEDGTMVSYLMQLAFQEIEPLYDTDYDDSHAIGF